MDKIDNLICFSVIMPTYNQCCFIRRAILSLMQQTYPQWELIIINDGCTDETEEFIAEYLTDSRITYIKNEENLGLGHALNQGLDAAKYDYIAYLPSDDFFFENHLEIIANKFLENPKAILVFTGMQYETYDSLSRITDTNSLGQRKGYCIQLVQTSHKQTFHRWTERSEWISEDLFAMFWHKLSGEGHFSVTNDISVYWTQHPYQRHRLISEKHGGGLNVARSYYHLKKPIKLRISKEKFWNEEVIYSEFRKPIERIRNSLKILLVGELAYNPERIYALEEAGHQLFGLWLPNPGLSFCTIGPLPFGHVVDISPDNWVNEIRAIKPDIIYGLLNLGAIKLCYDVMKEFPDIPFAWHLKEGPQPALRYGLFPELTYLYNHADVKIYLNEVVKAWFEMFIPQCKNDIIVLLDGDLPKQEYFKTCLSKKISNTTDGIHTVVVGRMVGLGEKGLKVLADNNVHVHLYTENYHSSREALLNYYQRSFPNHFHLHPHVSPDKWTKEFSKYDAGWMHIVKSSNGGSLLHATWDDLNLPARISTYMAAGIPVIISDSPDNTIASQNQVKELGIGVTYTNLVELVRKLYDKAKMEELYMNVFKHRKEFSFDFHVPTLIESFKKAINNKKNERQIVTKNREYDYM